MENLITIPVEPAIAEAYSKASSEHQKALQAIVSIYLQAVSSPHSPTAKRQVPSHLIGKGKTLGDMVSPIIDAEEWDCLR